MDDRFYKTVHMILFLTLGVTAVILLFANMSSPWELLFLSALLIISVTLRNALLYPSETHTGYGKLLIPVDLLLVTVMSWFDTTSISFIYYLVIIVDVSFAYSFRTAIVTCLAGFASHTAGMYLVNPASGFQRFIAPLLLHLLVFLSILAVMYLVRYTLQQNNRLRSALQELSIKSRQLENAYDKLRATSEELEEMTILRERNRIAREIHDTMGHTLTTALLEIEAGETLYPLKPGHAMEKIGLAREQIRKGLGDIRRSVGVLKAGKEMLGFVPSLLSLIQETMQHGGIHIRHDIAITSELSPRQEKALYRALQEGLTNGLKHGSSTAFVFLLHEREGSLHFMLQDNGCGFDRLTPGFGLTAMEERIREVNGTLAVASAPDQGCCIEIQIPLKNEGVERT